MRRSGGFPPLSSDALSGWGGGSEAAVQHNERVRQATHHLLTVHIPAYAARLDSMDSTGAIVEPLSQEIHRQGINVRHMGMLRSLVRTNEAARLTLLVEIIARTLKNLLRAWLRQPVETLEIRRILGGSAGFASSSALQAASAFIARRKIARFLNLMCSSCPPSANGLTNANSRSDDFYSSVVLPALTERFGDVSLTAVERADLSGCVAPILLRVVLYTLQMLRVSLTPNCESDLRSALRRLTSGASFAVGSVSSSTETSQVPLVNSMATVAAASVVRTQHFTFTETDIREMSAKIKHMSVVDVARGNMIAAQASAFSATANGSRPGLSSAAVSQSDPESKVSASGDTRRASSAVSPSAAMDGFFHDDVSIRLHSLAASIFDNALQSDPSNVTALLAATLSRASFADAQVRAVQNRVTMLCSHTN